MVLAMVDEAMAAHDLSEPMTQADLRAILRAIGTQRPVSWQLAHKLVVYLVSVTSEERVAGQPRCA